MSVLQDALALVEDLSVGKDSDFIDGLEGIRQSLTRDDVLEVQRLGHLTHVSSERHVSGPLARVFQPRQVPQFADVPAFHDAAVYA